MAEEFDLLAAKVLSGEATEAELARFRQMLAADAECRAEFEELRKTWSRLKELTPLVNALDTAPAEPPLDKRQEWLQRVERKFGRPPRTRRLVPITLALAAVLIAAAIIGAVLNERKRPVRSAQENALSTAESPALQIALTKPAEELRSLLVTTRDAKAISIYGPVGFTANPTPTIIWKTFPGQTYEVTIIDDLTPSTSPLGAATAVSPLSFTNAFPGRALSTNGLYRLRITETDKPLSATEITFRILPKMNEQGSDPLDVAQKVLESNPSRISDALTILLTLPIEQANTDRALRLKLYAFGQLGYAADFDSTLDQIKTFR